MRAYENNDQKNELTAIIEVTLVSKKSLIVRPPIISKLSLAYGVPLIPFIKIK